MGRIFWQKACRRAVLWSAFFLPPQQKKSLTRWLRGREEFRNLQLADWVLVSWGKSGRTWLRVMLSRFYQVKHGLPHIRLLEFDNLHRTNPHIPRVFFTHNNYLKDYTKHYDSKVDFYGKRVVLLVRDPRDVAVSQFFQWKYRMRPAKIQLNNYPARGEDVSLFEFVMQPEVGVPRIVNFLNGWAREIPPLQSILVVRYEDMRANPEGTLKAILDFVGTPGSDEQVQEAVAFASYDNMKQLEEKQVFRRNGSRLVPRDRQNPDSYKVRRAKVGGYRDYFDDQQVAEIDALTYATLSASYGYTPDREVNAAHSSTGHHKRNGAHRS